MSIKYNTYLVSGIISLLAGVACMVLIPLQIGLDYAETYGITSRTVPYAVSVLWMVCGLVLVVQGLVFKRDECRILDIKREARGLIYMLALLVYCWGFSRSFLISTAALGVVTLACNGCKKPLYYGIVVGTVVILFIVFTRFLHIQMP